MVISSFSVLPEKFEFWQEFMKIENVLAVKMAPFNRYCTFDVVRALAESGRDDITLYTGNDDNLLIDLLSEYEVGGKKLRIYAYFNSKNKLFEAVLLDVFQHIELFSKKTVAKAEREPERLTDIVINGFLQVHASHPDFWRLLAWANLEGPKWTNALNQARKNENEQLRRIYEQAVANGLLRKVKFEIWLFTLLAVTYFRYSNALTLSYTLDYSCTDREFEKRLSQTLDSLFRPDDRQNDTLE